MSVFKNNGLELCRSFFLESKKIDFLLLLGERTGHLPIVSKILSYLSDSDLQNVAKVSKTWQKLCLSDRVIAHKIKQFVAKRKMLKENSWVSVAYLRRKFWRAFGLFFAINVFVNLYVTYM